MTAVAHADVAPVPDDAALDPATAPARRDRRPQPADRGGDRLRRARRVRGPHVADDESPGALGRHLAAAVPLRELPRRLPRRAALALGAQLVHLRVARDARPPDLEHPRGLRVRVPALAGPRRRVHGRPRRADAAAAGDGRAALHHVGEARARRRPLAADHPELVRRRVRDLPAPPVLPHDPERVPRRRAGRRLRRAPRADAGRAAARQAGDRGGRALLRSSTRGTTTSCRSCT